MAHRWEVAQSINDDALREVHSSPLIRQVLWNRGVRSVEEARSFLKPDYARDVHDPFLFRDMEKAVQRILKAIDEKERIVIHGDYDADGVCASAILASTIEFLGAKAVVHPAPKQFGDTNNSDGSFCEEHQSFDVKKKQAWCGVYLPHRMEDGYGVAVSAVEKFARANTDLLITVDCGISSNAALTQAHEEGMDVIVVDHHAAPEALPPAHAIVHCDIPGEPYPFRKLSAGGVAFKLAQALLATARLKDLRLHARNTEAFEKWLLDLVAISTVADVMPLVGENRTLTHFGLQVLNKTQRTGLIKLVERARLIARNGNGGILNARNIAFHIAPRLNAAGRMQHASLAYDLLRATTEGEAERLAEALERANGERQRATEAMMEEARVHLARNGAGPITVAWGDAWSVGLVGLVAGKLSEAFEKPSFVIGKMKGAWTGSSRGPQGFDCIAALRATQTLLDRFGGHRSAAGFTLREGVEPASFAAALNEAVAESGVAAAASALAIDAETDLGGLTETFADTLDALAPFGEGNPTPLLLTRGCRVGEVAAVGRDGQHVKCTVMDGAGTAFRAIAFGHNVTDEPVLREGVQVDIVYEPAMNEWNGERNLELTIRDAKQSD